MGLLDDAIREHLDLRRRHGADPDEVAREELDALAPVPRDGDPVSRESPDDDGRMPFDGEHVADRVTARDDTSGARATSLMQETAEIDMHAILDGGALGDASSLDESGRGRAAPVAAGVKRSTFAAEVDGDPLAWEAPEPRARRVERRAGAERVFGGELPAEASAP